MCIAPEATVGIPAAEGLVEGGGGHNEEDTEEAI